MVFALNWMFMISRTPRWNRAAQATASTRSVRHHRTAITKPHSSATVNQSSASQNNPTSWMRRKSGASSSSRSISTYFSTKCPRAACVWGIERQPDLSFARPAVR